MLRVGCQDVGDRQREIVANEVVRGVAGEDAGVDAPAVAPVLAIDGLHRDQHGERARAAIGGAGERIAHGESDREVLRGAQLDGGREAVSAGMREAVDGELFGAEGCDQPLLGGEEHLRVAGDVLCRHRVRGGRRAAGELVLRQDTPAPEPEPRVGADAAAIERVRPRVEQRDADNRAVLPDVDARERADAVLLQPRVFIAKTSNAS